MKKIVLVFCIINLFCFNSWADNSARIKELQDENQKLSGEVSQAQQFIQQSQVEIISNSGAIAELKKLDAPKEPIPTK